jgi:hypothetical protein
MSRGTRRGNRQSSVYYVKSKDRYSATLDGRSKDFLARGEADEYLGRALNQREHGAPPVANRQTLSAYLDQWLARRVARREIAMTPAQGYQGHVHIHVHIHAILRKAFVDARRAGLVGFNPATTGVRCGRSPGTHATNYSHP